MNEGNSSAVAAPVTEVAFRLQNPEYPFIGLSAEKECRVELLRMLPREGERYAEFFTVEGADPESVATTTAERTDVDSRLLVERDSTGLFEFVVSDHCPARNLAELGSVPTKVVGDDGVGYIEADIPAPYEDADVIETFLDSHSSASLVAKREKDRTTPLLSGTELDQLLEERLTERQQEVLQAAFERGYYEQPREVTASELADELDVAVTTVTEHIRAAERHLLEMLYDQSL